MSDDNKCSTCDDSSCDSRAARPGEASDATRERQAIAQRLCQIKHKLLVLSGKGGVGKSTVSVNLAATLAQAGKRVGLLDVDIHGPSVPKLLHLEGTKLKGGEESILPVELESGLKVMSIGLLLPKADDAVIWRGPMKHGVIKQFLRDVEWGALDYLIVDCPPGTGDEPLAVVQLIENADGAVVVTTPQELAIQDVRRSVRFCDQLKLPVAGVVENMSGFVCPHCGEQVTLFGAGGGETMAAELGLTFLGRVPFDPAVVTSGDQGRPLVLGEHHSETGRAFGRIVRQLLDTDLAQASEQRPDGDRLNVAVPVAAGQLCLHFGHCEQFLMFEVDAARKTIGARKALTPPAHEPGVLPRWLKEVGADVIISGGMGVRAQSLLTASGIQVVIGASAGDPALVVQDYLDGTLQTGANICDH